MQLLVSPTEPPLLKTLGVSSTLPEVYGVDVCWQAGGGLCGVQRKATGDLISSARDGRLQRLMTDMRDLDLAILLIEGSPRWTADGTLYDAHAKWSLSEHVGVILGAQKLGVWVVNTASLQDTVQIIPVIANWTARSDHRILSARPGINGDEWGNVTKRQRQEHILQGLPGVGLERARRIIEVVGFPLGLSVGEEELLTVPGVGKGTVKRMREAME